MFALTILAIVLTYLFVGSVMGGLIKRWRLVPRDLAEMSPFLWPLFIFVTTIYYFGLNVMKICDAIMNLIEGEKK